MGLPDNLLQLAGCKKGDEVIGVLACTKKQVLGSRDRVPYLRVDLRDIDGATISGFRFSPSAECLGGFEDGDAVAVRGLYEHSEKGPRLKLLAIAKATLNGPALDVFLPGTYLDIEDLDGRLEAIADEVANDAFRRLLGSTLGDDAFRAALRRAPCTINARGAYRGAALEQVVSMGEAATDAVRRHERLNPDLLITAAIWHSFGLTRYFEINTKFSVSEQGSLLGSCEPLSVDILKHHAANVGFPERYTWHMQCCIEAPRKQLSQLSQPEAIALHTIATGYVAVRRALHTSGPMTLTEGSDDER